MSNELLGRNALVLGVERPAGRKAAVALAEAGADVAVVTLSDGTKDGFIANSAVNEFWAIGRKGIALTSDAREESVKLAILAATKELGPISIVVWHAPHSIPQMAGLRSDPAIIILIGDDQAPEGMRALLDWTTDLSEAGLRANTLIESQHTADAIGAVLKQHHPLGATDLASAVVYLASDASAAIEGAAVVAATATEAS
jgi:NAD(P)-dependent dehydrogenase (short-subunit alcohol dehydrogenase family)